MGEMEYWVQSSARGLYRWESGGWSKDLQFDQGQPITFEPLPEFYPIYCTFVQYITDQIVEIYIPPRSEDPLEHDWKSLFHDTLEEGNYYVHEGYLTPQ